VARSHDRIEAFDPSGAPLPMYAFDATTSSTHATATIGVGADLPDALGRLDAGLELRWYGLLAVSAESAGLAQYGLASLRLSLP
jgi:hypothetical protein